ncbi:hypothetical protein DPM33_12915 [Mesorhizobium hawassense]|uniref:YHYH domain-containing protein n=1 Tax=Mesorhizobium hawassense TaxID=1209954 RepID=A0A330HNW7_9HYPH|nr:hypothetical protein [Mesorhizobium hawassense]RAZ90421.1 hypothetical protein DPM33_12915 [Mesorhizobium hawassense]
MTKVLRNTLLAVVAGAAFAGSAMADQQSAKQGCSNPTNDLWSGRCCGTSANSCLGGGHDHDHGGRGRER